MEALLFSYRRFRVDDQRLFELIFFASFCDELCGDAVSSISEMWAKMLEGAYWKTIFCIRLSKCLQSATNCPTYLFVSIADGKELSG